MGALVTKPIKAGTTAGTFAAGDDNRIRNALQSGAGPASVGLGNVNNTSDSEKSTTGPIANAIATAINKLDTNGDGKVNVAEAADVALKALFADSAPWLGIANKPSSFPPAPHDASLITSGVFSIDRIPVLPSQTPVTSSGDLTALTIDQQNTINSGTVVTTTDGKRYVYKGSGSKTSSTSYIVLADSSPSWTAISNKPSTLTGFGIIDAQPLNTNLSSLASLSTLANKIPYTISAGVFGLADFTPFARSILDDADGASVRTTIGAYGLDEIGDLNTDLLGIFNAALT